VGAFFIRVRTISIGVGMDIVVVFIFDEDLVMQAMYLLDWCLRLVDQVRMRG